MAQHDLTTAAHATVVAALRQGRPLVDAAALAGLERRDVREWVRRGTDPRDERFHVYRKFATDVGKAIAEYRGDLLDTIRAASEKNWTAAAWLLERGSPHLFALGNGRELREEDTDEAPAAGPSRVVKLVIAERPQKPAPKT